MRYFESTFFFKTILKQLEGDFMAKEDKTIKEIIAQLRLQTKNEELKVEVFFGSNKKTIIIKQQEVTRKKIPIPYGKFSGKNLATVIADAVNWYWSNYNEQEKIIDRRNNVLRNSQELSRKKVFSI